MTLKIKQCDWEITTRCNLHCKHCIIDGYIKELDKKSCFNLIDNLSKVGCKTITFTGGEPLIKKDIMKIMAYSKSKGIENWIFTNGTLLNKKNITEIKKIVSYIGFSLEGLKKANDFMRGNGNFKRTMNAINLAKDKKIPFGIYITLNKFNIDSFEHLLMYIKKLKPLNISINELVWRGKALTSKKQIFTELDRKKIVGKVKNIFHHKFIQSHNCPIRPGRIFVDPSGDMYLCTEVRQINPKNKIGNIAKSDFELYERFIQSYKDSKSTRRRCPYQYYSSGNVSLTFSSSHPCSLVK